MIKKIKTDFYLVCDYCNEVSEFSDSDPREMKPLAEINEWVFDSKGIRVFCCKDCLAGYEDREDE